VIVRLLLKVVEVVKAARDSKDYSPEAQK